MLNRQKPDGEQPEEKGQNPLRRPRWSRWVGPLLLLAAAVYLILNGGLGAFGGGQVEISYSQFQNHLEQGIVEQVQIQGQEISGQLSKSVEMQIDGETQQYDQFVTYFPPFGDDTLLPKMEREQVEVRVQPESEFSIWTILLTVGPLLLLFFFFLPMLRRSQPGQNILSMTQSKAKLYDRSRERTTFDDVAGAESAKTELQEIIEFLREPERFHRLGGEMPKGVLLVGPPGTGKTLMARAVAGEADVPFFSITGSNFMEMFVGVGASRVRDLFESAKRAAPSIVFIDELDSIGRRRGAGIGGGHDEREQTLNQMLNELDGFEPSHSVVVMAATNRPDILDPALLRPGRFDRQITIDLPTASEREAILKIHARNKPLDEQVDLGSLASGTPGFSGADLENLLNESALLAARKGHEKIYQSDLDEARDKVVLGLKRSGMALSEQEMRMLAFHEGGHAILAATLEHADPIHKVTIVPRGRAMGVTQQMPEGDKYIYTKEYLLDRLAVMMGGRAAEKIVFNTASSGAENDLKSATKLARKMVLDWGMSDQFESVALGSHQEHVFLGEEIGKPKEYSEETARLVDEELKGILNRAFSRAENTLQERREQLNSLAEILLEEEEVSGDRVLGLVNVDAKEEGS
ncbi:MAG: ATP-dependent zinc metalloprotease FtsH [Anaerolineales bacterium]|jgi:cell division protease FtsH